MTNLGLYIHIPFCASRCNYCAFCSNLYDAERAERYLHTLEQEASRMFPLTGNSFSTVFIGGGTPSILSISQLKKVLALIPPDSNRKEFTVECNPDSIDRDKLCLLADSGVTRISFGVQTFSSRGLRLLGRRHDAVAAANAISLATTMPFQSFSIDLISAWPGETLAELRTDIDHAVSLGIQHVSCYTLIPEEGTSLGDAIFSGKIAEMDDAQAREFWDLAEEELARHGFNHYETSNFSLPGFECRHNVDCWKGCEYIGLGASAHSHSGGRRFSNTNDLSEYFQLIENSGTAEVWSERLEPTKKARETAVFWLRLAEGIDVEEFEARTGISLFELYREELPRLIEMKYLEQYNHPSGKSYLRIGKEFYPLADMVLEELV